MDKVKNVKKYVSFNNMIVRLFVLGGYGSGESIVVIFFHGDDVVFSIVIDCCMTKYDEEDIILPVKLLHYYGVKKLDCIVWTHPHDDHSYGMDKLITDYYGKNTIGILPKQLYAEDNSVVKMSGMCKRVLNTFNKKFSKKNLKSMDCLEGEARNLFTFPLFDTATDQKKEIKLFCLTPIDYYLDDKLRKGKQFNDSLLNDLSLTLVLSFDNYYFFFGGDAPDKTILKSNREYLGGCRWIKIPHHSSQTALEMISMLNKNIDSAASTTFFANQLPKVEVLNKYVDRTENVYVTQKNMPDAFSYGMIEYEYKFGGPVVELHIKRYGNAYKYERE